MSEAASDETPGEERYGPVRVLFGERGGRYPDGNSLLIEGGRETLIIDPALGLVGRASASDRVGESDCVGALPRVDRVLNSHCHEDHIAGNHLFPAAPWHFHAADAEGITSLDAMLAIYGYGGEIEAAFRKVLVEQFHYTPRPDPARFVEGDVFELGDVSVRVLHTPGHTRGHCCFLVEWREAGAPRRLLYLGDIELTRFGPYYGDAVSDLADFERSLARVRGIEADWYATFHHIGVLAGRAAFLERLDIFEAKIGSREAALLEFLHEPHSLAEVVAHRFVYRQDDDVGFADPVEKRSMEQHIARLLVAGRLRELPDGRYVTPE